MHEVIDGHAVALRARLSEGGDRGRYTKQLESKSERTPRAISHVPETLFQRHTPSLGMYMNLRGVDHGEISIAQPAISPNGLGCHHL